MAKNTQKLYFVPPLPVQGIPEPWNTLMQRLDRPAPKLPLSYSSLHLALSPSEIENQTLIQWRLDMEEAQWRSGFYWVVKKKWNPKLKIPLKRRWSALYEPWGELLYRGLELCLGCHRFSPSWSPLYPSAAHLYECVMQEAKQLSMMAIVANKPKGKMPSVRERYSIVKSLKDDTNPANSVTSPHFHQLVEVALSIEDHDEFNERYWTPFLRASSQWTQLTASESCQETFIEDNKLMQRRGKGRGTITLVRIP